MRIDNRIGTYREYNFIIEVIKVYTYFIYILKVEEEGYISLYNIELSSTNRDQNSN